MELKDLFMAAGALLTVAASHFRLENKTDLVRNDLDNHKLNHEKLEKKVADHENKIDERLQSLHSKFDELKDLIIEKMK